MARPREFDEKKAIDLAVDVFWRNGFADTSISDLEQALSMGRQSIYNTFGGKRELFLRALQQYFDDGNAPIQLAFGKDQRGLKAIEKYLEVVIEFQTASEDRLGCFLTRCLVDHGTPDDAVAQKCKANEKRLQHVFVKALQEAQSNGEVAEALDVDAAALHLATQIYGLSVMARSGISRDTLLDNARFLIERLRA